MIASRFTEEGLESKDKSGRSALIPWNEVQGLYFPYFGHRPYVRSTRGTIHLPAQDDSAIRAAILDFYAKWTAVEPQAARKNAFDYAEPQGSGAGLVLGISVLFCFLLAGVLFNETWTQAGCSKLLADNPVVQKADVQRLRKRQQGNFTVGLKFTTAGGEVVEGKRLTMKTFDGTEPSENAISVIYPASNPQCWVLSQKFMENDINWAKRRYSAAFNLLVGISFLIVGIFGSIASVIRLRQKRPARKEVAERFHLALD